MSRPLGIVIAAVATIVLLFWLSSQKTPVEPRTTPPSPEQKKDYSGDVRRLVESAAKADQAALDTFNRSLEGIFARYQTDSLAAAEAAAAKVATYESIGKIIAKLAYDQVKGTNESDDFLQVQVGPVLKPPIDAMVASVNTALFALENDLQKSTVQLAVDLAALGPADSQASMRFAPSGDVQQDFQRALRNLGIDAAAIGVAIAFDIYAIANASVVRRLVASLASIAGRMFAKQVAKTVVTITGPLVDGPLPIGDVIAVVFGLWTAYDISQLQPAFHAEVKTASGNHLREIGAEWEPKVRESAVERVSRFKEVQAQMGRESLKQLGD